MRVNPASAPYTSVTHASTRTQILPSTLPSCIRRCADPIWFGIIVVKLRGFGLLTPPVGLSAFVVNGVRPDIPLSDVFRGIWPFLLADVVTLALLTAYPQLVTFVVDLRVH